MRSLLALYLYLSPISSSLARPVAPKLRPVAIAAVVMAVATALFAGSVATPNALAFEPDELDHLWETAYLAWDGGDYVAALEGFIEILDAPGGDRFFEPIALLTGELYRVDEVAPDGRGSSISPDGRRAAFQVTEEGKTITRVVDLSGGYPAVAEIEGTGFIFSPTGAMGAYLAVGESDELAQAREEAEGLRDDFMAYRRQLGTVRWLEAKNARVVLVDLESGETTELQDGGLIKGLMRFSPDGGTLFVVGAPEDGLDASDIYAFDVRSNAAGSQGPVAITAGGGFRTDPIPVAGGEYLVCSVARRSPLPQPPGEGPSGMSRFGGQSGTAALQGKVELLHLGRNEVREFSGGNPAVAASGRALAFAAPADDGVKIEFLDLAESAEPVTLLETTDRYAALAISPGGGQVAVQLMPKDDWELFLLATPLAPPPAGAEGAGEDQARPAPVRLTREIQHDLQPRFLTDETLLGLIGEGRHRRSYLYDVATLERTRLFHNNTVRTIAPEYEWDASADGSRILIVADRDGDTISPERPVYLVDLNHRVTEEEVIERLHENLASERSLVERGKLMFAPIADEIREVTEQVSLSKIYEYQKALFDFDSKNITQPGNALARAYILDTFSSFGYEPELQWFETEPRGNAEPVRTANVMITIPGAENPDLVYVLSSHFDSNSRGPGADDNSTGAAVLLEAARVLAGKRLPATIIIAAFTGEESGLLGSREFMRQAVENGLNIVGALNNDMFGWSNDHRLDNTIRYSNAGIRDLQHAAAFLFSDLITYDAHYYRSTDAAAFYESFGDIVGGIGSYPVLGNPHYHQATDLLETINHELVTESTKATVAALMLMASSPAPVKGLEVAARSGEAVELQWTPSPEAGVTHYVVRYAAPGQEPAELTVEEPRATIPAAPAGTKVGVRAVNGRSLHGWGWAKLMIEK
jgi:hypothetical protein